MLWILMNLAAATAAIAVVAIVTTGLQVASLRHAFFAAVVVTGLAWVASLPLDSLQSQVFGNIFDPAQSTLTAGPELYLHVALLFAVKTIVVLVATFVTPGVLLRGFAALFLLAALLTAFDFLPLSQF